MGLPIKELVVRVAYRTDQGSKRRAEGGIRSLSSKLGGLAAIAGTALAGIGASQFIRQMIQVGDEVGKTSKRLGIAVEDLQKLQFAADRSGVETEAFNQSIVRLSKNMFEANRGSALYVEAVDRLGLTLTDSEGQLRDVADVLPELADAFGKLESNTERTALATTLLGRTGPKLLPFFDEGSEGIAKLTERFEELGGGLSQDFTAEAERAQDAMTDFNTATDAVRSKIALALLPSLTKVTNAAAELIANFSKMEGSMGIVKAALFGLAAALGVVAVAWIVAFAKPILIIAFIAAAVAAFTLLIDDLILTFQGGDTVLKEFIDTLFGVGATDTMVRVLTALWSDMVAVFGDLDGSLNVLLGSFNFFFMTVQDRVARVSQFFGDAFQAQVDRINAAINQVQSAVNSAASLVGLGDVFDQRTNQRGLAASRTSQGSGPVNVSNGGSTINVNGAGNPQAVAREVNRQMRREQDRQNRQAFAALQQRAPA